MISRVPNNKTGSTHQISVCRGRVNSLGSTVFHTKYELNSFTNTQLAKCDVYGYTPENIINHVFRVVATPVGGVFQQEWKDPGFRFGVTEDETSTVLTRLANSTFRANNRYTTHTSRITIVHVNLKYVLVYRSIINFSSSPKSVQTRVSCNSSIRKKNSEFRTSNYG